MSMFQRMPLCGKSALIQQQARLSKIFWIIWCPLLLQRYQATKTFILYRSIGRICAMGQARQRCHCEVGVRHRGSAVAQFIWIMGEIARRETNRVGWISKKLLEKAD
jgi:3-oxoacyl-ACP reductase-like protein